MFPVEEKLRTASYAVELTTSIFLEPRLRIAADATDRRPSAVCGSERHIS
jgi:hypothetical protein